MFPGRRNRKALGLLTHGMFRMRREAGGWGWAAVRTGRGQGMR